MRDNDTLITIVFLFLGTGCSVTLGEGQPLLWIPSLMAIGAAAGFAEWLDQK